MEEDMMGMQVDPVMMPDQMSGMQPQPMMQGTPIQISSKPYSPSNKTEHGIIRF